MNAEIDPVKVLIGGKVHQAWESYRIDSDLLTPADDWQMVASAPADAGGDTSLPDFIFEGAEARVMLGEDQILSGRIDTIEDGVSKRGHGFSLYGRDLASALLDCSAPMLSMQLATLEQIIAKAVAPFGIKDVVYLATPSAPRKKVHTELGQSVWQWLQSACEANHVWPWFSPMGKLIIGAPDYAAPVAGNLILRADFGADTNVKSVRRVRSIHQSFSEITVLGQSSGDGDVGHHDIKGAATDDTMPLYRPRTVIDGNCESNALATARAEKLMADSRMARDGLQVIVQGHRVMSSAGAGVPWAPGMRVHVISEPHKVDAVYFLMKREFILDRAEGRTTDLRLIPDGTWLLNVPFIKAKRRAGYGTKKGHYVGSN
jgi:prophage tail gpP-like protein